MPAPLRVPGDLVVLGNASFNSMTVPNGAVADAQVSADARIAASKLIHQFPIERQLFAPGVEVAAKTELLRIVYGSAGTLLSLKAVCTTAPAGGDKAFTVDLQRSRQSVSSGAFESILTEPLEFSVAESSLAVIPQEAILDGDELELLAEDLLQIVVAVSGSTGTQAQGLLVTLMQTERAA